MNGWTIAFEPVLPLVLIGMLGAIGLALVGALALAHARAWPLRALSLAILLAALANPTIRSEEREPLTDIAVAVIDRSLSQESAGRTAATDQAAEALKILGGFGQVAVGRLLLIDSRTMQIDSVALARDPACSVCGPAQRDRPSA